MAEGDLRGSEQGFITTLGRWVRRRSAMRFAEEAGQVKQKTAPAHGLFSEDIFEEERP